MASSGWGVGGGVGGWEVGRFPGLSACCGLWAVGCQIPKKMSSIHVYFHFPVAPAPSNHNKLLSKYFLTLYFDEQVEWVFFGTPFQHRGDREE